jgi:guanosine-3',5'-bis(diphosphate) 3'-pyrophosphohydrolase
MTHGEVSGKDNVQKILDAALFAAQKHTHQRRKGVDAEPYVNHLIEVAQLVANATTPAETEVVIAALLHDSIEDVGVTKQELVDTFGQAVADLVMEVTDDKTKPKSERKTLQVVSAPFKSPGAGLIKLADKISNLRAIKGSPPADWSPETKREYVAWASKVIEGLKSPNPILMGEFEKARTELL